MLIIYSSWTLVVLTNNNVCYGMHVCYTNCIVEVIETVMECAMKINGTAKTFGQIHVSLLCHIHYLFVMLAYYDSNVKSLLGQSASNSVNDSINQ